MPSLHRLTLYLLLWGFISLSSTRLAPQYIPSNTLLAVPSGYKSSFPEIVSRQTSGCDDDDDDDGDIDPETPQCRTLCGSTGGSCSSTFNSLSRRWPGSESDVRLEAETELAARENEFGDSYNRTDESSRKYKRTFGALTQGTLRTYVYNQFQAETWDDVYDRPLPLAEGEGTATVTQQVSLDHDFQIGAHGLHGCTIVTIVSKRAVHMGHYWENPSWAKSNVFQKAVLNFISGKGKRDGIGPPVDVSLFNADDDDTRIYIMHPRKQSGSTYLAYNAPNYSTKLEQLKALFVGSLGILPKAKIVTYHYKAIEAPGTSNDNTIFALTVGTEEGRAVFQFDTNARGAGVPGWRLFYEHNMFSDTDPTPSAISANGIPDQ